MSDNSVSTALITRVASYLQHNCQVDQGDRMIVAVSGGSDSLALLHILHLLGWSPGLLAVYIDHGLRPPETPLEQKNIEKQCALLQIPFIVRAVDVVQHYSHNRCSPEESARILRYDALEKVRADRGAQAVAVGHTADDQVEEFFIRLIRGSGVSGLSGMRPRQGDIVRPLLCERKETLIRFLVEQGISWNFDTSNNNRRFLRNRVRLDLLPLLESSFNPSIRKTMLHSMNILRTEDDYLKQQATAAFKRCVTVTHRDQDDLWQKNISINPSSFIQLHPALARRILEKCFWLMEMKAGYEQINALMKLLTEAQNGSEIHLAGGVRAVKDAGLVTLLRPAMNGRLRGSSPSLPSILLLIPATGTYPVPETEKELVVRQEAAAGITFTRTMLQVDMAKVSFPMLLRSADAGERFHPYNSPGTRKISRFLNDRKIPARERPAWPVLLSKGKIIALPGLQIDHDYRVTETTRKVLTIGWRDRR